MKTALSRVRPLDEAVFLMKCCQIFYETLSGILGGACIFKLNMVIFDLCVL